MVVYHKITYFLDKSNALGVIYLAISKAFDTMPHEMWIRRYLGTGVRSVLGDFADDSKLGSITNVKHVVIIQEKVDKLVEWRIRNRMKFNSMKCKAMYLETNKKGVSYIRLAYIELSQ